MWEAFIILGLILLNGLFSMSEMALVSARKSKLQTEAEEGGKRAKTAFNLASEPEKFLSAVQIGITLIGILTGLFSGNRMAAAFSNLLIGWGMPAMWATFLAQTIIVLIVMYFTILFGELVPKRIALSNSEKVAKAVAGTMKVFEVIVSPLVTLLSKSTIGVTRLFGIKESESKVTEEEIKSMIQEGTDDGEVSPVEQDIVERVFTLGDLSISTIMTLRDDIVWLDLKMTEDEIINTIEENIYEQYPVVDGDLDHVVGILSLKDYVLSIRKTDTFCLEKMMKEPEYVHENMSVYTVLEQMKAERFNRALVCDEFGSLSGIVSIKDILDALVGNLDNAEDDPNPDIVERTESEDWLVEGQCSMYDFLTYFELDDTIEDYDFSTVGGLILDELEHVPDAGEIIQWNGFSFEVANMDGARIDKIIVKRLPEEEEVTEEVEDEDEKEHEHEHESRRERRNHKDEDND